MQKPLTIVSIVRFLRKPLNPFMREIALFSLVCAGAVTLGFLVSFQGILMWDDHYRIEHSHNLLGAFGIVGNNSNPGSYGPLFELILGIMNHFIFASLNDELWVRHSLLFALLPIGIYLTYKLLHRSGTSVSTSVLVSASLIAIMRFDGHSLFNMKDFPGAMVYLISSIGIWVLLSEGCDTKQGIHYSIRSLFVMGVLASIPFLTRSPLLLHIILLQIVLLIICLFDRRKNNLINRIVTSFIPTLTSVFIIALLYPPMWGNVTDMLPDKSTLISSFLFVTMLVFASIYIMSLAKRITKKYVRIVIIVGMTLICSFLLILAISQIWPFFAQIFVVLQMSFGSFSDFGWRGSTIMFNRGLSLENLPWWYAFGWIPIIAHPLLFVTTILGFFVLLFRRTSSAKSCVIPLPYNFSIRLSIEKWLLIIVVLSFASISIIRPTLYNDERHILFLYPVFFVLGMLGIDYLRSWSKYLLTVVLLIVSVFSYTQWGRYSYTYVSPIIPKEYRRMNGDYWAVCMSDAAAALPRNVPKGAIVRLDAPKHIAFLQEARLKNTNALSFDPDFDYILVGGNSFPSDEDRPFAVATNTMRSVYYYKRVRTDIENGMAIPILMRLNPYGEAMCMLALYPALD